ncbi:MAG: diguanylate cyclase [Eubacteriales bacterium]
MHKSIERLTEKQYKDLVDNSSDIIFFVDKKGEFIYINNTFRQKLEIGRTDLKDIKIWDFLYLKYIEEFKKIFTVSYENKKTTYIKTTFKSREGNIIKVEGNLKYIYDEEKDSSYISGVFADKTNIVIAYDKLNDITEYIKNSQDIIKMKKLEERYKKLFENVPIVIWEEDYTKLRDYLYKIKERHKDIEKYFEKNPDEIKKCLSLIRVVDVNKHALSFYKAKSKEDLINNLEKVFTEKSMDILIPEFKSIVEGRTSFVAENETKTLEGEKKTVIMEIKALDNYSKVYLTVIDVTDLKKNQEKIEYLNFHDHLTGLYNRRYMEDSMKRLDTKRNYPLCLMSLDVNGLKLTNDAFGHDAGDKLLKNVGLILEKTCRGTDIIGRFGGDEFVILLTNTNKNEAKQIKKRIMDEALKYSFDFVIISLAIGYSIKTSESEDIFDKLTEADNYMYKDKIREGREMRNRTLNIVINNINDKCKEEQYHRERVSKHCELIAKELKMDEKDRLDLRAAGMLHDIGKVLIPKRILNKKGRLNKEEIEIVKKHPETGYQILKNVYEYSHIAEWILHHHERWDGKGYPKRLSGEEIPLMSRIISVADAYDSLTTKIFHEKTKTKEEALEILKNEKGKQFDPEIVDIFIEYITQG